jgi:ankyrin repeat protein
MKIYERMSAMASFEKQENPRKDEGAAEDFGKALRNNADINEKDPCTGETASMITAGKGCPKALTELLRDVQRVDLNAQNTASLSTALMYAVEKGQVSCVQILLKQPGLDVAVRNSDGENALDIATFLGKKGETKLYAEIIELLKRGAPANTVIGNGNSMAAMSMGPWVSYQYGEKICYYNSETKKRAWSLPEGFSDPMYPWVSYLYDEKACYYNSETKERAWSLPEGLSDPIYPWVSYVADDGKTYYYNCETKESARSLPEGIGLKTGGSGGAESKTSAGATKTKSSSNLFRKAYSIGLNNIERSFTSVLTIAQNISDDFQVLYEGDEESVEATGWPNFRWQWPETRTIHFLLPFSELQKKIPRGGQCPNCNKFTKIATKKHCKTCYCCEECAPSMLLCMSSKCKEDHLKTALMLACEEGHAHVVECLLHTWCRGWRPCVLDVDKEDTNPDNPGRRPLTVASMLGYEDIVASLLRHEEINVNRGDREDGWTPLMHAASCGHEGVVRLLLKHPKISITATTLDRSIADSNEDDTWTWLKPRHEIKMGMSENDAEQAGLLMGRPCYSQGSVHQGSQFAKARATYAAAKASTLHAPFKKGERKVVKMLDATGMWFQSTSSQDVGFWFPVKAVKGYNDIASYKLSQPGHTALTLACQAGYLGIVKVLLDKAVSDACHRVDGCVTTLWAACSGPVDSVVLNVLVKDPAKRFSGALSAQVMDTTTLNLGKISNNMTPLIIACLRENSKTVELLLKQDGINIFTQCKAECGGRNLTALIAACEVGNIAIVTALRDRCIKERENGNTDKVNEWLMAKNLRGWSAADACQMASRTWSRSWKSLGLKAKNALSEDRVKILQILDNMNAWLSGAQLASLRASAKLLEEQAEQEAQVVADAMAGYEQEQKLKEVEEKALAPGVFAELEEAKKNAIQDATQ